MKKGFTLIELMVVIVIMVILAAVAIPKLFGIMCSNQIDKCRAETPNLLVNACRYAPEKCTLEELEKACYDNTKLCSNKMTERISALQIEQRAKLKRTNEQLEQINESVKEVIKEVVKHDTVYIMVNAATVIRDDDDPPTASANTKECVEYCKKNNVSKSLVDFCIKDKCK